MEVSHINDSIVTKRYLPKELVPEDILYDNGYIFAVDMGGLVLCSLDLAHSTRTSQLFFETQDD